MSARSAALAQAAPLPFRRALPRTCAASPFSSTPEAPIEEHEGGLRSQLLREAPEEDAQQAFFGASVSVHYVGKLDDDSRMTFDESYGRGEPISFTLGAGQVIKGWDEGIALMKVGEKRRLFIPPELGYGARGAGPIPPNAGLIFECELVSVGDILR